jgi:hypothetical protein
MQVLIFTLELFQCENSAQELAPPRLADHGVKNKKSM